MDERDDYGYGYGPIGQRVEGLKSGRRQGRVNMIAGTPVKVSVCTILDL